MKKNLKTMLAALLAVSAMFMTVACSNQSDDSISVDFDIPEVDIQKIDLESLQYVSVFDIDFTGVYKIHIDDYKTWGGNEIIRDVGAIKFYGSNYEDRLVAVRKYNDHVIIFDEETYNEKKNISKDELRYYYFTSGDGEIIFNDNEKSISLRTEENDVDELTCGFFKNMISLDYIAKANSDFSVIVFESKYPIAGYYEYWYMFR